MRVFTSFGAVSTVPVVPLDRRRSRIISTNNDLPRSPRLAGVPHSVCQRPGPQNASASPAMTVIKPLMVTRVTV